MADAEKKKGAGALVGLVLFSHADLARSFVRAVEMVAGEQPQVACVAVDAEVTPNELEDQLDRAIRTVDRGAGVIVMTDLFGGSPANLSLSRLVPGRIEVVSGMNLAMLLKAVDLRRRELSDPLVMSRAVAREGRENIVLASAMLDAPPAEKAGAEKGGAD